MFDILVIDDDPGTLECYRGILRTAGFRVIIAESGQSGLALAREHRPRVVIADLQLPDCSGLDVIRDLRHAHNRASVIIVTGFGTPRAAVEAIRLGASDFVEKPLIGDDLVAVVARALLPRSSSSVDDVGSVDDRSETHAQARWVRIVVPVIDSPGDIKTLKAWAHWVGASVSTLKTWCRTAGFSPRHSLMFARLLRVVIRHRHEGYSPEEYLDVSDSRTLIKLLRIGGGDALSRTPHLPSTLEDFLGKQQIVANPITLRALATALGVRGSARD